MRPIEELECRLKAAHKGPKGDEVRRNVRAWSPDGEQIALIEFIGREPPDTSRGGRLEVLDVSTSVVTRLTDLVGVDSPAWQPT